MFKILILCLALAIFAFAKSAVEKPTDPVPGATSKGFKFLGTFAKNDCNKCSSFFLSPNDASWESSARDCKTNFHAESDLVTLETAEKRAAIKEFLLDGGDAASLFWVGGLQDTEMSFIWNIGEDGVPIEGVNWETGEPQYASSRLNRVLLRITGRRLTFLTKPNSETERAICEYKHDC